MAECIIARGGGGSGGSNGGLPPVIVGVCQIVANVYDSDGNPMPNMLITCKDGESWYNYHTNNKGQALFVTNSGSANITAWNISVQNNFRYIDQNRPSTMNVDAPITTSKFVNFSMTRAGNLRFYETNSNIYNTTAIYSKFRFRVTNGIGVVAVGGAGGGGGGDGKEGRCSTGGGGGAKNAGYNVAVNKEQDYSITIGKGGRGAWTSWDYSNREYIRYIGSTGGSSSALGVSASGGRAGSITNHEGGQGMVGNAGGGGNGANNSRYYFNGNEAWLVGSNGWGGGGGAYTSTYQDNEGTNETWWWGWRGKNGGGRGGYTETKNNGSRTAYSASDGTYGGGGGGCYNQTVTSSFNGNEIDANNYYYEGGNGGSGFVGFNNFY